MIVFFCCAGCGSVGYHRAGWEVVGVDIAPQPNYPFKFVQADALEVLRGLVADGESHGLRLKDFHAIHASPPCQHFTKYGNTVKDIKTRYEDLLAPTRELLQATKKPYVIENVERSPLEAPTMLCGSMFDARILPGRRTTNDIQRHRLFETNWPLEAPGPCDHSIWPPDRYPGGRSVARGGHSKALVRKTIEIGSWDIPIKVQKWAMGVEHEITVRELSEGTPPAFTKYVGHRLKEYLLHRPVGS